MGGAPAPRGLDVDAAIRAAFTRVETVPPEHDLSAAVAATEEEPCRDPKHPLSRPDLSEIVTERHVRVVFDRLELKVGRDQAPAAVALAFTEADRRFEEFRPGTALEPWLISVADTTVKISEAGGLLNVGSVVRVQDLVPTSRRVPTRTRISSRLLPLLRVLQPGRKKTELPPVSSHVPAAVERFLARQSASG